MSSIRDKWGNRGMDREFTCAAIWREWDRLKIGVADQILAQMEGMHRGFTCAAIWREADQLK